jgi:hypothetical protein
MKDRIDQKGLNRNDLGIQKPPVRPGAEAPNDI